MIRFTLALVIMVVHLAESGYIASQLALLAFYALTGYTATITYTSAYRHRPGAFLLSRFLRLWPAYALAFVSTLLLLLYSGAMLGRMGLPLGVGDLAAQFLGWVPESPAPAVIPPGWALRMFAACYLAIALGIAATPTRAGLWLLASLGWANWQIFTDGPSAYYSLALASLCFAAGSAAYHLGLGLPRDAGLGAIAAGLSYPLYIVHYPVGAGVGAVLGLQGWPLFWASLLPTLTLAWLLLHFVERPVDEFRKTLRS